MNLLDTLRIPKESRKQVLSLLLVTVAILQVTAYEVPLVGNNVRLLLALKLPAALGTFIGILWAFRRPQSLAFKIFVGLVFAYYPVAGSVLRPWYALAMLQLAMIYAFFFDVKPKLYFSYLLLAVVALYTPFILRWPNVPETREHLGLTDWLTITTHQAIILGMAYTFVLQARAYQKKTEASFLAIGKYASRVTHDLKGMLGAPLLYLDHAKAVLSQSKDVSPVLISAISETQRKLSDVHLAVSELSRLTATEALPVTKFSLSASLHSSSLLFRRELELYSYSESDRLKNSSLQLQADRSLVVSLLFELFSLALSELRGKSSETKSIDLVWDLLPIQDAITPDTLRLRCSLSNLTTAVVFSEFEEEPNFQNLASIADELKTQIEISVSEAAFTIDWKFASICAS